MAQNLWPFPLTSGSLSNFRNRVNGGLENVVTFHSGATEPAVMHPYMYWADTTALVMKQRDGANAVWTVVGPLNARAAFAGAAADFLAGISASVNRQVWMPEGNAFVTELVVWSDTATTGSVSTDEWRIQVRNKTAANNLRAVEYRTRDGEIAVDTALVIPMDANQSVNANAALELQIVKTGTPTSLAASTLRFFLRGYMRGAA